MKGIMKGASRSEDGWKKIKFNEPYKKATDRFRKDILNRPDMDPTTFFQFGLFMAKGLLQLLDDVEEHFGPEGQKVCNEALVKVGYDIAEQMFGGIEIPPEIPAIELVSFIATQINTVAWTSVEDPRITDDDKCEFDIVWCPLQDVYRPFDCRIQRYLVQGMLNYVRKLRKDVDFNVEFVSTIPAGAETCLFKMVRRSPQSEDKWKMYSELLEKRALKRWRAKQKKD